MDPRYLAEALMRGEARIVRCEVNRYDDYLEDVLGYGRRRERNRDRVRIEIDCPVEALRYYNIENKLALNSAWITETFKELEPPAEVAYKKFIKWQEWHANAYERDMASFELHKAQWANANDAAYNTLMAKFEGYKQDWVLAEARKQDAIRNCLMDLVTATKVAVLAWADNMDDSSKRVSMLELR